MNTLSRQNIQNIKKIFESKTGVALSARKPVRHPVRNTVILVAVLACCLTATAFAGSIFSSLSGDELNLYATYSGNGVVSVLVENLSDKELRFQPDLKLMRWTTSEEIEPLSEAVTFHNTTVPAHSSRVMTIDLSAAYDLEQLEQPLAGDWYYLVLTNQHFVFGQDWMCSVDFTQSSEPDTTPAVPAQPDAAAVQGVEESLQFYFETISFEVEDRRAMDAAYIQAYTALFDGFEANIVSSVSPLLPGNRISSDVPYLMVGEPEDGVIFDDSVSPDEQHLLVGTHWKTSDVNFKLLATSTEHALVLSAGLPLQDGDSTRPLPLFYLFTYEKASIHSEEDCAFIYGQLIRFADLEAYKVYEDETNVCYEVSGLIYSDLAAYTQRFVGQNPDIHLDEQAWSRVENIYTYYKENLGNLFYYK